MLTVDHLFYRGSVFGWSIEPYGDAFRQISPPHPEP